AVIDHLRLGDQSNGVSSARNEVDTTLGAVRIEQEYLRKVLHGVMRAVPGRDHVATHKPVPVHAPKTDALRRKVGANSQLLKNHRQRPILSTSTGISHKLNS